MDRERCLFLASYEMHCNVMVYVFWHLSSFLVDIWLATVLTVTVSNLTGMTVKLLEFLPNSTSEVHGSFLHSCFMLSLKNVCFHLLHSPSHEMRSITNSGFFSCLISSQSVFVRTFLILNTWIHFILPCVNLKAVNTWMYTTSQGLFIIFFRYKKKKSLRRPIAFRINSKAFSIITKEVCQSKKQDHFISSGSEVTESYHQWIINTHYLNQYVRGPKIKLAYFAVTWDFFM